MNQLRVVRCPDCRASLQHERNGTRRIERRFARQQIAQGLTFKQFHHDVKITVVGRAKIVDGDGVRMVHAPGRARLALKTLLRRRVADESLAEHFDCD